MDEQHADFDTAYHPADHALSHHRQAALVELLAELGFQHINPGSLWLYDQALTHSSFTYENGYSSLGNYERLEFLGDAVLKLVVSDYLYERFPHYREGELTKIRAVVVSDTTFAKLANTLGLGAYIVFGPSEARSGGARKNSNLACAFEALMGAFYLDGRQEGVRALLFALIEDLITEIDLNKTKDNFKAVLQEYTQGVGMGLPDYVTTKEQGPSHNRLFEIEAHVAGKVMGVGRGKSKKEAQQSAAHQALIALGQLPGEPIPQERPVS
jgi:ribonuclease III